MYSRGQEQGLRVYPHALGILHKRAVVRCWRGYGNVQLCAPFCMLWSACKLKSINFEGFTDSLYCLLIRHTLSKPIQRQGCKMSNTTISTKIGMVSAYKKNCQYITLHHTPLQLGISLVDKLYSMYCTTYSSTVCRLLSWMPVTASMCCLCCQYQQNASLTYKPNLRTQG